MHAYDNFVHTQWPFYEQHVAQNGRCLYPPQDQASWTVLPMTHGQRCVVVLCMYFPLRYLFWVSLFFVFVYILRVSLLVGDLY